jgi:hypothetical protein
MGDEVNEYLQFHIYNQLYLTLRLLGVRGDVVTEV